MFFSYIFLLYFICFSFLGTYCIKVFAVSPSQALQAIWEMLLLYVFICVHMDIYKKSFHSPKTLFSILGCRYMWWSWELSYSLRC